MRAFCPVRIALGAVAIAAAGCSPAPAQHPEEVQVQPEPGDLFRCFAHQAYFKEMEAGIYPKTRVMAGTMKFHSVTPDERWVSSASVEFLSIKADPGKRYGNGLWAIVSKEQPDTVQLFVTIDGVHRPLGTRPYGTPVPYKVSFDDAAGTVTIESGNYRTTAKPEALLRATMNLKCVGADVSFKPTPMEE